MKEKNQNRLHQLHLEQERLRGEIKASEQRLNEQVNYLEDHFGVMLLNSVLPFKAQERENISDMIDSVNGFFSGFRKNKSSNENAETSQGFMKSIQLVIAGIVFRYLKKMF